MTAGVSFSTTASGKTFYFTLTENLPNVKYFEYNGYHDIYSTSTTIECVILDENISPIKVLTNVPRDDSYTGGTEITGFVSPQTSPVYNEKCEIVCINKSTRTIKCFPFGTAYYREIEY